MHMQKLKEKVLLHLEFDFSLPCIMQSFIATAEASAEKLTEKI